MPDAQDLLTQILRINETSAFNRWCGIEVVSAEVGRVEIAMPWREEAGQYSGFLHAGLVGALIDTACGIAAAKVVGRMLALHFSVNCLRPAVGTRFIAKAKVIKPGKTQVFTSCELFAQDGANEKLVATGETLLTVVAERVAWRAKAPKAVRPPTTHIATTPRQVWCWGLLPAVFSPLGSGPP